MTFCNSQTAHIVHLEVLGIDEKPFVPKDLIRKVWHSLFTSNQCFTDNRNLLWRDNKRAYRRSSLISDSFPENQSLFLSHESRSVDSLPTRYIDPPQIHKDVSRDIADLPQKPFLRNLGSIRFNPITLPLLRNDAYSFSAGDILDFLHEGKYIEGQYDDYLGQYIRDIPDRFFGYNPAVKDQRMLFLNWSLCKPISILSRSRNDVKAQGKVFVHIFPCGYIVLVFSINLDWRGSQDNLNFNDLLLETRPWRKSSKWCWESRLGNGKLYEILSSCHDSISASLYSDSPRNYKERQSWTTAIKIASNSPNELIASELGIHDPSSMEIQTTMSRESSMSSFISSPQGNVCVFKEGCKKKTSQKFFWKVISLIEFVSLKKQIYSDYNSFFEEEILRLRGFRLSPSRKFSQEDLLKFSVYDHKVPEFLWALDKYIQSAAPFHRRIYSQISAASSFDIQRRKTNACLKEWINEVEQWEYGLVKAGKTIVSPLKLLLGQWKT